MMYIVVGLVLALYTVATLGPLREGAVCTAATHRARVVLGLVCGALAVHGTGLFVRYLANGGDITTNVVVGRVVTVVLALQCALLVRTVFPRRAVAIPLAVTCAALALAAFVHAALA